MKDELRKSGRNVLSNLIWSIKELGQFKALYLFFMIMEAIVKGVVPIVALLLTQQIVNMIQVQTSTLQSVVVLLIILTVFEILSELSLNFFQVKLNNYEMEFDTFLQVKILSKVSVLDSKDFENSSTYDLINRTQYDANAGILGNIRTFFSVVSLSIGTVSYMIILVRYSFLIFLVVVFIPIIRYYFEKKYNLLEYDKIKKNTEPNRKASYISYLLTNAEYFKEIKMFGLFRFFINQYEKLKVRCNLDLIKLHNKKAIIFSLLSIVETAIDFVVTLGILAQTFGGKLLIGQFILYNNSINSLKQNMTDTFSQISTIYQNSSMVEQIREFFELTEENINETGVKIDEINKIKLENVYYKYSDKDDYTLKNINLTINRGEFIVFMGYNGSGKSTLMKVIMGLYSDYEGEIYIDNVNLKEINKKSYREKIGTLFQDYIKYESSISENIWYGNLSYRDNEKRIDELLTKVNLEPFTDKKSQVLGYQFHEGRQISIGQWQKLALARTIIKDAHLFIFDEPNSALDLVSENAVLQSIYEETSNKIALIIMHRFNHVLLKSNNIVVLKDGAIEEMGTHNELLNNKGTYQELYSIQNNLTLENE